MREELADGDVVLGGDRSLGRIVNRDVQAVELGDELGRGVSKAQPALFEQHQHRRGGHYFGHGRQAENGIVLHRLAAVERGVALSVEMHELAVPNRGGDRARNVAPVDVGLHVLRDALQSLRRHTD